MEHKRKRYITDKVYQWRLALRIISICSVYLLLNLVLFNYLSYRKIEFLRWKMNLPFETTGEIVEPYLISSTAITMSLAVATLVIYIIFILNKTSGPVYRLKADMEKAADGDLSTNIYLRSGDDFKETAKDCNNMVLSLRGRFARIKEGFSSAEKSLEKIEYVKDRPEIAAKECKALADTIEALKKEISSVKVENAAG
ncbi:MAG: methyl-accepting chemotaxis protein [Nitrospiraceae bacterium]|nr:MAG: methyl-accepting chemotaxis protein [Nitrospiraceae bacterium]